MSDKVKLAWQKIKNSYTYSLLKSYIGLQILSQINSLISLFFVAQYLGPENLGIISYSQYLAILTIFINTGIDTWATYEFLHNNDDARASSNIFSKASHAKIINSIISLAIVLPLIIWKADNTNELLMYIVAICMSTFSSTLLTLYNSYAIANRLLPQVNRAAMLSSLSILLARLLAVYIQAPTITFLILILSDTIITITVFLLANRHTISKRNLHILNLQKIKKGLKNYYSIIWSAKYYICIVIFSLLATRTDLYILKFYVDNHELGIYSAAMRLAEYPTLISGVIGNILVINLALGIRSKIRYGSIALGYISNIAASLVFILLFTVWGKPIIDLIYGHKYNGVEDILIIYSVGLLGIFVNNFSTLIFMTHKKEKYFLYSNILGGILLFILCKLWIPEYGLYGAATASSLTYIITGLLSTFIAYNIERRHKQKHDIVLV